MTDLNRRAAIGALAAVIAAPAAAAHSTLPSSPLLVLVEHHREATSAYTRFQTMVAGPAEEACAAAIAKIPHFTTASFANPLGGTQSLATSRRGDIVLARQIMANPPRSDPEFTSLLRELVDAAAAREVKEQELREQYRFPAIARLEDRLTARETEALAALVGYPVATIADLHAKVAYIRTVQEWDFPPVADAVAADIRRIAGVA